MPPFSQSLKSTVFHTNAPKGTTLLLSFIPLFIVDTGVSVTTDTTLLPIDLAKPNHPNYKSSRPCGFGFLGGGIA